MFSFARKSEFFIFSAAVGFVFVTILFLSYPAGASACGLTKIDFPADGQNLNVALPYYANPQFDISSTDVYFLDIYSGAPGNATILNGHSEGGRLCEARNQLASNQDFFSQPGDYFYVLYSVGQVDIASWRDYWMKGAPYPFPIPPNPAVDYAVSKFSINKTQTLEPVIIIPGILGSSDKDGVWVIDPILHTYDNLIDTLKANGYTAEQNLFTMPYDWRQSNVLTALQLRDKIREVEAICNCAKVDLVAHSMGGLVARQYIESDKYENNVDHLIFLGTPHLGAPKAYFPWEAGTTGVEFDVVGLLMNAVLRQEAIEKGFGSSNPKEILFNYIHSTSSPISSLQEILPIYSYLKDSDTGQLRTYPTNYPANIFLEDLNTVSSLLKLEQSGVKISNIFSGSQNDTVNFIKVKNDFSTLPLWKDGIPTTLEKGSGDRTVPIESASSLHVTNKTDLNISGDHTELPTVASSEIIKIFTGKLPTTLINTSLIKRYLTIFAMSPIDLQITAPDGKRIGKDFATSQEVNEIPGAFYSGFKTDNEYITIPNPLDGEYKITTQGTGTGHYTVATGYISDNASVDKDFTAQTQPGLVSDLNVSINTSNPLAPAIDVKPKDIIPPEIKIISPEAKDYLRSDTLPINLSIVDKDSGVFSQEIKFDDTIVKSGDNIDLFFQKLGGHSLKASASDFVGNATSTAVSFRIVATTDSVISDIERAFSLGWITSKKEKDELVKDLQKTIKLEKRIETLEQKLPNESKLTRRIERIEKRIDKILGKSFLKELQENYKKRIINDKAFNLLTEDINWLLNN